MVNYGIIMTRLKEGFCALLQYEWSYKLNEEKNVYDEYDLKKNMETMEL